MSAKSWLPAYGRSRITRRRFLGGAAAGAGAIALAACGGGEDAVDLTVDPSGVRKPGAIVYSKNYWQLADESKEAAVGGTFPGRNASDLLEAIDPFLATDRGEDFTDQGYEYLLMPNRGPGIDPLGPDGQKMRPNLAEDFEVSNDALTYTFTLRRGVKFHPVAPVNGREMTIDDWKASYERQASVGANRSAMLEHIDKAEFPDARHMVIKTKAPYGPLIARMSDKNMMFKIVPKELAANPSMLATTLIGTSFRMVDKVQPSVTQEWKRFDDYWGGKPFIERWHYPLITETANAQAQFLTKNIITFSPSARDALRVRRDAPDALMVAGTLGYHGVTRSNFGKLEKDTVPWKDPRVRIAIHKAVNWDAFLETSSNKSEFAAAGIEIETGYMTHAPFNSGFFLDPRKNELGDASKNYFYDLAAAKQLLTAAGFPDGIEVEYLATTRSPDIVQVQTDELKKSGFFTVKVNNVPLQFYNDNVQVGAQFRGFQFPAPGGGPDFDFLLSRQYYSTSSTTIYGDPKMDALIDAQRKALDPNARNEILKDWARLAAQTFPMLPGNHTFGAWTFDWGWLHNVNYADSNDGASYRHWLAADMPKRNG